MASKAKIQPTLIGAPWNFATVWNKTLDSVQDRPMVPRNYLYASELGQSFIDRYLKMYCVPFTNPPNFRSRRKFQAGNMWEWVVAMVFIAAGLLKKKQIRVETELKNLLRVSGRLDYVVGGSFDYEAAKKRITEIKDSLMLLDLELPPFFFTAIDNFVDEHKGQFLQEVAFETKSVSSFMMEKVQKTGAMPHHVLQDFHYVFGNDQNINQGKLMYLCKDDCIAEEFVVSNNKETFDIYRQDIKQMTDYYNNGFDKKNPLRFAPPKEPHILFEEGTWRFTKNFKCEYSQYLTYLFPEFETPEAFRMQMQPKIASWSRVFKRCVKGDNMTTKNNEVIIEAKKSFPLWDKYVQLAKKDGAFQKPEENEEE